MTTYDLGKVTGETGQTGATGNGIASISKTGTSGLVDTYTITFTNGNSATFTVTNGSDASVTIVTSFSGTTSDSKVPSEKLVKTELDKKIATSSTSGLMKNDGTVDTNTYLTQHQSLSNYVQKSNTSGLLKNDGTVMTSGTGSTNFAVGNHTHSGYALATHNHTSLISEMGITYFNDDEISYLTAMGDKLIYDYGDTDKIYYDDGNGAITNNEIARIGDIPTVTGKENSSNKVTSWSSTTTDDHYPSEKLVKDSLDAVNTLIGNAISYINQ